MRYILTTNNLKKLFLALGRRGYPIASVAQILAVSERTLRDWRRGKYTIPGKHLVALTQLADIQPQAIQARQCDDWWYAGAAGSCGGRAYMEKYGSLGTPTSRRAGGIASYNVRKQLKADIYTRKRITLPPESASLAEFFGIMIGDGSIGSYQISISLDSETDALYAQYVSSLILQLFETMPRIRVRRASRCIVVEVSSVNLVEYLTGKGLTSGNKLQQGLRVPSWILHNQEYTRMCVRGMFDTDGSIYQEVHSIKARSYSYARLSFVSASPELLRNFHTMVSSFGIHSVMRGTRAVKIERFTDIKEYFRIVGSSNPKHLRRFAQYGGVA